MLRSYGPFFKTAIYGHKVSKFQKLNICSLAPIGSHVNENEKENRKKKCRCVQKTSQRMVQGKKQPEFEINLCIRLLDNCDTDGRSDGRTTENVPYYNLCCQSQGE